MERKDNDRVDRVKQCMLIKTGRTRLRGCSRKTWRDCVKDDMRMLRIKMTGQREVGLSLWCCM